jgi:chemotaxis-related protein WspB
MLFVVFKLREDRYALESRCIIEIVPLVEIKLLPGAPLGVAGVFDYRGTPVPAIDLCALTTNRAAIPRLSTRIIVVHYVDERAGRHVLGLVAEGATETIRRDEGDFATFGLGSGSAPFLGPVTRAASGFIQRIEVNALLSASIEALLFEPVSGVAR